MQPVATMSLEKKVAQAKWPRSGRLLSRQNPGSGIFYGEFVYANDQFAGKLREHFGQRGNLISLVRMLEEQRFETGVAALRNYASGMTNRVPLQTYNAIASLLNENDGTSLEQKALPDVCSGFYVGLLFGWYFDKVDEKTKGLENPMPLAVEILLTELAQADKKIAALSRGTKGERHIAECLVRDALTGRRGLTPFSVFNMYETGVIASLGVYSTCEKPEQLRKAFEGADRMAVVRNGFKVSTNLEASLEAQLRALILKPYQYNAKTDYTLPAIDYFEGESIMHPTFGKVNVIGVDVTDVRKRGKGINPYNETVYAVLVRLESGNVVPLTVRKQPPAFSPHFA